MTKQTLKDKIQKLENQIDLWEDKVDVAVEKAHLSERQSRLELRTQLAKQEAVAEQLQKRIDEHPYKQLTDLLKAIAVKLPELNIKELAIHTKSKK